MNQLLRAIARREADARHHVADPMQRCDCCGSMLSLDEYNPEHWAEHVRDAVRLRYGSKVCDHCMDDVSVCVRCHEVADKIDGDFMCDTCSEAVSHEVEAERRHQAARPWPGAW